MNFSKFSLTFFKNDEEVFRQEFENIEKNKNRITFDFLEYNTLLDINKEIFIRENEDYLFTLDIKNKCCTIQLKKENLTFDINIDLCELNILENKIELEYLIESEDAKNRLVIEKIGE